VRPALSWRWGWARPGTRCSWSRTTWPGAPRCAPRTCRQGRQRSCTQAASGHRGRQRPARLPGCGQRAPVLPGRPLLRRPGGVPVRPGPPRPGRRVRRHQPQPPYRTWLKRAGTVETQAGVREFELSQAGNAEGIDNSAGESMLTDPLPADLPYAVMFDALCDEFPPPLQNHKDCTCWSACWHGPTRTSPRSAGAAGSSGPRAPATVSRWSSPTSSWPWSIGSGRRHGAGDQQRNSLIRWPVGAQRPGGAGTAGSAHRSVSGGLAGCVLVPVEADDRADQEHEREPATRIPLPPHPKPSPAAQPRRRPLDLPPVRRSRTEESTPRRALRGRMPRTERRVFPSWSPGRRSQRAVHGAVIGVRPDGGAGSPMVRWLGRPACSSGDPGFRASPGA
jgi:hypothetical protein